MLFFKLLKVLGYLVENLENRNLKQVDTDPGTVAAERLSFQAETLQ